MRHHILSGKYIIKEIIYKVRNSIVFKLNNLSYLIYLMTLSSNIKDVDQIKFPFHIEV